MKKICIPLLLLLLLSSCGTAETTVDAKTTSADESASVTEEETASPYADGLPADLDLGGETVTFLYRSEKVDDFYSAEINGDIVEDAIYESHSFVEERLNAHIEVITKAGQSAADRTTFMNSVRSTVLANEDSYDWVDLMVGNAPVMMQEGLFRNLFDVQYIDTEKPYYMDGLAELCTINNQLYFVSGDASLGYLKDTFCFFFNKRIAEEYDLGNFYSLVDSGEWTIDKLMELCETVCKDLDGNGIINDKDQLGFRMYDINHLSGFIASTEFDICQKDGDGNWVFEMNTDRNVEIVDRLHQLLYETDGAWVQHPSDCQKFANGEVLFISAQFSDSAEQLREMEDEYGILPYPKLDAEQEQYSSNARTTHNSFSMPITCGNPDAAAAVLEALGSRNYETVSPTYFEIALKTKFASDEETAKMYDVIRGGLILEFGYLFSNIMENPITNVYIKSVQAGESLSSTLASQQSQIVTSLETYLDTVQHLND